MLDIHQLRKDLPTVIAGLRRRGFEFDTAKFLDLENRRKQIQARTEKVEADRNQNSKMIGQLRGAGAGAGDEEIGDFLKRGVELAVEYKQLQEQLPAVRRELDAFLRTLPNIPKPEVVEGADASCNRELRRWGEARTFAFPIRDHVDVGVSLKGIDFETATKIAGARFSILKGGVARLHRALSQFMLDIHTTEHGYTEVYVPYMVNAASADGVSSLTKFKGDLFRVSNQLVFTGADIFVSKVNPDGSVPEDAEVVIKRTEQEMYLIPTAEYPVTNFVRDDIVDGRQLPLRFVCHSPCFRSEAGSYGKDTRGMIRQHQFDKVELVQIVHPEASTEAHEALTGHAEAILQRLELPYRVMLLATGDLGFSSAKTYDLEVWLPGQDAYREISSCSNFEAFQARRMQARYRDEKGKVQPLHTLNGSGLAVGRTLVAVLENCQNADGSVTVPKALVPYMGGETVIR